MDPPPKQPSTNSPPPPLQPPQQVSQPQPQESEPKTFDEIKDSQLQSWFQEIFPGQDLPPCLQPQQEKYQDSFPRPQLKTVPRANPLPWYKSPERLLLLQLYPYLDSLRTDDSHLLHHDQLLAPPHSPPKQEKVLAQMLQKRESPPCQPPPPQLENVLAPQPLPHHSTSPLPKQADSCSS